MPLESEFVGGFRETENFDILLRRAPLPFFGSQHLTTSALAARHFKSFLLSQRHFYNFYFCSNLFHHEQS